MVNFRLRKGNSARIKIHDTHTQNGLVKRKKEIIEEEEKLGLGLPR